MKRRAKKVITKLYQSVTPQLEDIKDKIGDLMDSVPDENQLNLMVIICSEIISGFEEIKDQEFILDTIKQTLEELKK